MKTKYCLTLIIGGIFLVLNGLGQIGNQQYEGSVDIIIIFFFLTLGVASVIFGFKLRKLSKENIKDTKDKKYLTKISKEEHKAKYCKWSIAALIFAFLGGIVGIILGIIALFNIKKNPDLRGKGMAITAIIIALPMTFIWMYFSILDPSNFLPEESQIKIYCEEICIKEQNLQNVYIENDPNNISLYTCSCLNSNNEIISQYKLS